MLGRASEEAARAAARAGVSVRALHDHEELAQARAIWDAVWPTVPGATEVTQNLLRAIEHAGGYVGGAFEGTRMVGSCLAIVGRSRGPAGWHTHLHSHVAAALPGFTDRGIGTALKLHQRSWALGQGIDRIVWTFDPLVRRNAQLNLVKLGGLGVEYLVDFYGAMDDVLNVGDTSDRLLVQWDLASTRVERALAGGSRAEPDERWLARGAGALLVAIAGGPELRDTAAQVRLVAVPDDIVAIRRDDPALARRWRARVRAALEPQLAAGGRVVGLTGDGSYVLEVPR